uniref:RecQ-mediated genome instability protein 1 n=1 Tax=Palpitomonas bilix TaxID=652834 RepID=A0A7S3GIK4_9EUKA|mmetsp:Transcript_5084/g.11093  ORF Transcript_5084/g.11093 Transcript_5084/m.11093 type:complete len:364 (+) Transcript_5084:152-1243(+)
MEAFPSLQSIGFHATQEWAAGAAGFVGSKENRENIESALFELAKKENLWRIASDMPVDVSRKCAVFLQIDEVVNIGSAADRRLTDDKSRVLKLGMTNGRSSFIGVEVETLFDLSVNSYPGTKAILLCPVPVKHGLLLLSPSNFKIVGGRVSELWHLHKSKLDEQRSDRTRKQSTTAGLVEEDVEEEPERIAASTAVSVSLKEAVQWVRSNIRQSKGEGPTRTSGDHPRYTAPAVKRNSRLGCECSSSTGVSATHFPAPLSAHVAVGTRRSDRSEGVAAGTTSDGDTDGLPTRTSTIERLTTGKSTEATEVMAIMLTAIGGLEKAAGTYRGEAKIIDSTGEMDLELASSFIEGTRKTVGVKCCT